MIGIFFEIVLGLNVISLVVTIILHTLVGNEINDKLLIFALALPTNKWRHLIFISVSNGKLEIESLQILEGI